jgi:hypothetical protein
VFSNVHFRLRLFLSMRLKTGMIVIGGLFELTVFLVFAEVSGTVLLSLFAVKGDS